MTRTVARPLIGITDPTDEERCEALTTIAREYESVFDRFAPTMTDGLAVAIMVAAAQRFAHPMLDASVVEASMNQLREVITAYDRFELEGVVPDENYDEFYEVVSVTGQDSANAWLNARLQDEIDYVLYPLLRGHDKSCPTCRRQGPVLSWQAVPIGSSRCATHTALRIAP